MASYIANSVFCTRPVISKRSVKVAAAGEDYARTLPGITAPTGFFDPLKLSAQALPEEVKRWREVEVTHGRVCMLAAVGFVVGENLEDVPLFFNWDGSITGPAINQFQQVSKGFWEPLVLCIGLAEAYRVQVGWNSPKGATFNTLKDDYEPGDLGFDPLGLKPKSADELFELQTKELNNGRLAMISVAGFVAQELVNQKGIFEHLLFVTK